MLPGKGMLANGSFGFFAGSCTEEFPFVLGVEGAVSACTGFACAGAAFAFGAGEFLVGVCIAGNIELFIIRPGKGCCIPGVCPMGI